MEFVYVFKNVIIVNRNAKVTKELMRLFSGFKQPVEEDIFCKKSTNDNQLYFYEQNLSNTENIEEIDINHMNIIANARIIGSILLYCDSEEKRFRVSNFTYLSEKYTDYILFMFKKLLFVIFNNVVGNKLDSIFSLYWDNSCLISKNMLCKLFNMDLVKSRTEFYYSRVYTVEEIKVDYIDRSQKVVAPPVVDSVIESVNPSVVPSVNPSVVPSVNPSVVIHPINPPPVIQSVAPPVAPPINQTVIHPVNPPPFNSSPVNPPVNTPSFNSFNSTFNTPSFNSSFNNTFNTPSFNSGFNTSSFNSSFNNPSTFNNSGFNSFNSKSNNNPSTSPSFNTPTFNSNPPSTSPSFNTPTFNSTFNTPSFNSSFNSTAPSTSNNPSSSLNPTPIVSCINPVPSFSYGAAAKFPQWPSFDFKKHDSSKK